VSIHSIQDVPAHNAKLIETAKAVIATAYETQPHLRLAIGKSKCSDPSCIGSWYEQEQRYIPVAYVGIDGKWYQGPGYELLINGQPVAFEWTPVPQGAR
jgi:hypothetical protein